MKPVAFSLLAAALLLEPPLQAAPPAPVLEPLWVRLVDTSGAIDEERDTASVETAEFSPDGTLVAAGSKGVAGPDGVRRGQRVVVFDAASGRERWSHDRADEIEAVAFTPDGRFLAAAGEDRLTVIHEAGTGAVVHRIASDSALDGMRFSPDGGLLAVGSETGNVILYRVADWGEAGRIHFGDPGDYAINSIDFTPDSAMIAVAGGWARRVKCFALEANGDGAVSLRAGRILEYGEGSVKSVRVSPDGRLVAAGGGYATGTKVWDLATGECVATLAATGGAMEAVEFSRDGRLLFTGGTEGKAVQDSGRLDPRFPPNGGIGHIRIHAVEAGFPEVARVPVFRQEYLHGSRDGAFLVSGHEDGTVRLWRMR